MEKYTFEEFEKILDDGYQVYFTYLKNRYLLFKISLKNKLRLTSLL